MLAMPAPTPYDLRFRLLGIPVSVHPLFWVATAIMGYDRDDPARTGLWIACVFASILVHEYGHGLVGRALGARPRIALYWMGGLCAADRERTPVQSVAVSLAGPGAGFLLYGLVYLLGPAILNAVPADNPRLIHRVDTVLFMLEYINLYWGLVNLLPIWPLDGGQVAAVVLTAANRWSGMRWTHILGLALGAVAAVVFFAREMQPAALLFAYLAFGNFQAMQAERARGWSDNARDPADWWKQ